ncbi:hypothetical protein [Parabacteroides gordonii]|uniref:hypothetical protein n=1 Tax=Parabacteroides gordonii TaxID=574930 RepID=UPI0026EEC9C6|nr:hypothetical protein [Parabacteroides gordonii]
MKHLHLLKIRSAAATLCVAVLLSACSNEIRTGDDEDGELTIVTLKVGPALNEQSLTTKGLSPDQENIVHNLYILAFQPDNTKEYKLQYYATGRSESGGNGLFSFTLRRSVSEAADTKLLLIANLNPFTLVKIGMTYNDVQKALKSGKSVTASALADNGIPMFGFAGDSPKTPQLITDEGKQLSANLLRAVARVDVGVGQYDIDKKTWDKGSIPFELTDVIVYKPYNQYALLPEAEKLSYKGNEPFVTAASEAGEQGVSNTYTGNAITNNTYCQAEIYLPEVVLKGKKVYDPEHESRTALVIGGHYNKALSKSYYRIDFTTAETNVAGIDLHDVLRNHIYRYSITGVSQSGYSSADDAYKGKPVKLDFTASIIPWELGVTGKPNPDMLVRMNFEGINGTLTKGRITDSEGPKDVEVKEKTTFFITDNKIQKGMLDYNRLLGEAIDNAYNGTGNGGIYQNVQAAFDREGPYAKLVIAPDNATPDPVPWRSTDSAPKDQRVLDAKKACWDYRGQGLSDWRLPRLSELCLLWLNRVTINQSKGFTSLGDADETYWSASEGPKDKAYAVSATGKISQSDKKESFWVRCVREIK